MILGDYNTFCRRLRHTSHFMQWDSAHVWKVGGPNGEVFAIDSRGDGDTVNLDVMAGVLTFNGVAGGGKPVDTKVVSLH